MSYDRQDTTIDLDRYFPVKEMHHMILAQIHGTLYLNECLKVLNAVASANAERSKSYEDYKRAHGNEIEVDFWETP